MIFMIRKSYHLMFPGIKAIAFLAIMRKINFVKLEKNLQIKLKEKKIFNQTVFF